MQNEYLKFVESCSSVPALSPLNRQEMGNTVVPARPEEFELLS